MVEQQQDLSDVKAYEVDVFRDTALRYLGESFIYCDKIVMTNSKLFHLGCIFSTLNYLGPFHLSLISESPY